MRTLGDGIGFIYYYRLYYMRLVHVLKGRSSDDINDITVEQNVPEGSSY